MQFINFLSKRNLNDQIGLKNDHTDIMKKIEQGLELCFTDDEVDELSNEINKHSLESDDTKEQEQNNLEKQTNKLEHLGKVNQVQFGSPAEAAGLKTGDLICQFGYANSKNHNNLKLIRDVVIANEDNPIDVIVLRNNNKVELRLKPKKWSGNGLLG